MSEKRTDAQHVLDAIGGIDDDLIAGAAAFREEKAPRFSADEEKAPRFSANEAKAPKFAAAKPVRKKIGRIMAIGMPLLAAAVVGLVILLNGGLSNLSHNASGDSAAPKKRQESTKSESAAAENAAAADPEETGSLSGEILVEAEEAMGDAAGGTDDFYEEEPIAMAAEAEAPVMEDAEAMAEEPAASSEADMGVSVQPQGAVKSSEADGQMPVVVLPEAPVLRISGDGTTMNIAPGAQSWICLDSEGSPVAGNVDAPSVYDPDAPFVPLSLADGIAVREKNAAAFVLYFPLVADRIAVEEWKSTAGGAGWTLAGEVEPEADGFSEEEGTAFILHGGCRYRITANWGESALQRWGGFGEADYIVEVGK